MAKKPKSPKPKLDRAQEKARKQKRMASVLGVFLVLVLVYEVPHTMKLMNQKAKAPIVTASATTPAAATPTTTTSSSATSPLAATPTPTVVLPAASSSSTGGLVAAVQVTPDQGQLTEFERFASKDPFTQSVQKTATGAGSGTTGSGGAAPTTPKTQPVPKPPAQPLTTAVISLNGELMSVAVGAAFPTAGVTFGRVGSLFKLDALTAKTAKVSIIGGSYADGAPALTLEVGTPATLQNTADGTRYTLILKPLGTKVPASTTTTSTTTTPTTTTPSVVPPSPSG